MPKKAFFLEEEKKKNSFSFGNSVYIFLLKTTRTKGQRPKESFNLLQTSIECKIKIKTRWRGHGPEFLFFSTEVASLHDLFESINIYIYIYISFCLIGDAVQRIGPSISCAM
jgi:hypothetical protein